MQFPVLHLIKPQDIIHQLKDKNSKKLLVALVLRFGVVLARNLGFLIGQYRHSEIFRRSYPVLYSTLDLVYCLSGCILVSPRCILNFICVRVAWKELFTFEIRADRCILVAIFGVGFLGFYVASHHSFW